MKLDTLNGTPVTPSMSSAPVTPSGTASTIASGPRKLPNCATSSSSTAPIARASTPSSSRNDACWLAYWPPISSVTPAGSGTPPTRAPHVAPSRRRGCGRWSGRSRRRRAAGSPAAARSRCRCRAPRRAAPAAASRRARRSARARARRARNRTLSGSRTRIGTSRSGSRAVPASAPNSAARAWASTSAVREPEPRHPRRVELHPALGVVTLHAVEQVHQPGRRLDRLRHRPRGALGGGLVAAEELELHRLGRAGQVADHVLHQLHELHPHRRRLLLRRHAHPVHHLVHRRPLSARLEQHGEVAAVGRRGREAELAAGPAGERLHRRDRRAGCPRARVPGGRSRTARRRSAPSSRG